ncbi:MAG: substrate-binding domain-containing protein [Cellulomonas sp.]
MASTASRRFIAIAALAGSTFALVACSSTGTGTPATAGSGASGAAKTDYVIGVSNTLVGNGWREQMICSVKVQAAKSGQVSKVIVANRNGGANEQIADLQNLISQGVNAIIVDPSDAQALTPVIDIAASKGIVVMAVDQAVDDQKAYVAANDQVEYGRVGAEWLFKQLGGKGNVAYLRGIAGAPADTDRDKGFQAALKAFPDIKIVATVDTGWDYSKAGQQITQILNTSKIDGVWTSGTDYTVVNAFDATNTTPVPVVGQATNEFIHQLTTRPEVKGAVVTNPAVVGAVGTVLALKVLNGEKVDRLTMLKPRVLDMANSADELKAWVFPDQPATFASQLQEKPYTTYTDAELLACKGPGE